MNRVPGGSAFGLPPAPQRLDGLRRCALMVNAPCRRRFADFLEEFTLYPRNLLTAVFCLWTNMGLIERSCLRRRLRAAFRGPQGLKVTGQDIDEKAEARVVKRLKAKLQGGPSQATSCLSPPR